MGIFLITAISEPAKIEAAIKRDFENDFYQLPRSNSWFVRFEGMTRELSDKVGISNGENGTGVVLSIANYYGRAPTDMWEWIKTRMERD